jgi:hypothetical protein
MTDETEGQRSRAERAEDIIREYARWMEDAKREHALRAHDREHDFFGVNNAAAIKSGEEAIKALILINGGSSVAMLAFVGALASKDQYTSEQLRVLANPLIYFASGVGLAGLASIMAYLSNRAIAAVSLSRLRIWEHPFVTPGPKTKRWTVTQGALVILTALIALASLASFGCGTWTAKHAFEQLPKPAPHTMPFQE